MFDWNENDHTLWAHKYKDFKTEVLEPGYVNPKYKEYMDFINKDLPDLITKEFIPALEEYAKMDHLNVVEGPIISPYKSDLIKDKMQAGRKLRKGTLSQYNLRGTKVELRLNNGMATSGLITFMILPYINEQGILWKWNETESRWQCYSFIDRMESNPSVNLDGRSKSVKFVLDSTYIEMHPGYTLKLSTEHSNSQSRSILKWDLIFAAISMGRFEKYKTPEIKSILKSVSSPSWTKKIKNFDQYLMVGRGNRDSINGEDYTTRCISQLAHDTPERTDNYNIGSIRSYVNKFLSISRANGYTVADDVYDKNGNLIVGAGTVIGETAIAAFHRNHINSVKVFKKNKQYDYMLAEDKRIITIPAATIITDDIRDLLPESEHGNMYVSHDIDLGDSFKVIRRTTRINESVMMLLEKNGYNEISVYDGKKKLDITLTENIVGNNTFIDQSRTSGWVYDGKDGSQECTDHLTFYDMVAMISAMNQINAGDTDVMNMLGNVDLTFRKRFTPLRESLIKHARNSFKFWKDNNGAYRFKEKNKNLSTSEDFAKDEEGWSQLFSGFSGIFRDRLFDDDTIIVSLSADNNYNPIHTISGMTKIGVSAKMREASDNMIAIPMGSFGKIDTCEVPQSHKLGLVMNKTIRCRTDNGVPKTPYRRIERRGNSFYIGSEDVWLSVMDEEMHNITDIGNFEIDDTDNRILAAATDRFQCRSPMHNGEETQALDEVCLSEIQFVSVYPDQEVSWASSTIPFFGANDGMRAIFGVSQAKQAKGIIQPEAPHVMTPASINIPRMNNQYCIFAEADGYVKSVTRVSSAPFEDKLGLGDGLDRRDGVWEIIFDTWGGVTDEIRQAAGPMTAFYHHPEDHLKEEGQTPATIQKEHDKYLKRYVFQSVVNTGYSVLTMYPVVAQGQMVKKGELLASSNFMYGKYMAIGANAFVAYCPDGYNYEDGAHVSASFTERMSSVRISKEHLPVHKDQTGAFVFNSAKKHSWVNKGNSICSYKRNNTVVNVTTNKVDGFFEKIEFPAVREHYGERHHEVVLSVANVTNLSIGDKMANRHGNKGVVSRIEDDNKMFYAMNGRPFDIVYNPLGVISRKNIGQVLECHLSLACEVLGIRVITETLNGITTDEVKTLLSIAYQLANTTNISSAKDGHAKYPEFPMGFWNYVFTPEVQDNIRKWTGVFNERGEGYIINPNNGHKKTETPCVIGFMHVYKLIQESAKKAHVRAGFFDKESEYTKVGAAPTHGSDKHGGQRIGFMELDALSCYNVPNFINQLYNERGDNTTARSKMYLDALGFEDNGEFDHGRRRSLTRLMYYLLSCGILMECDEDEFINLYDRGSNNFNNISFRALQKYMNGEKDAASQVGSAEGIAALDKLSQAFKQ